MPKVITISKEDLARVYAENTNIKAAKILRMSPTTLMRLLVKMGIPQKGRGNSAVGRRSKFIVI